MSLPIAEAKGAAHAAPYAKSVHSSMDAPARSTDITNESAELRAGKAGPEYLYGGPNSERPER